MTYFVTPTGTACLAPSLAVVLAALEAQHVSLPQAPWAAPAAVQRGEVQ